MDQVLGFACVIFSHCRCCEFSENIWGTGKRFIPAPRKEPESRDDHLQPAEFQYHHLVPDKK